MQGVEYLVTPEHVERVRQSSEYVNAVSFFEGHQKDFSHEEFSLARNFLLFELELTVFQRSGVLANIQ